MWEFVNDKKNFTGGKANYVLAEQAAMDCGGFVADEDEEWVAEEELSCYNCRYRRWTADSFTCMNRV